MRLVEIRILIFALSCKLYLCRVLPNARQPKLSLVEWDNYYTRDETVPGTYSFGYDIDDAATNNIQTRSEERYPNGTVVGSYGYVQPDGSVMLVNYRADENGYRSSIGIIPRGTLKAYQIPQIKQEESNRKDNNINENLISTNKPTYYANPIKQYIYN